MYAMDNLCECDFFRTSNFVFILSRGRIIDFGPSTKNKMAAIELVKMYAMDNPCESDIFRTISPVYFKIEISFHIIKGRTLLTLGHLL